MVSNALGTSCALHSVLLHFWQLGFKYPNTTRQMSQPHQQPQSAIRNIPRVVVKPTWDNLVACSYLPKVRRPLALRTYFENPWEPEIEKCKSKNMTTNGCYHD
jgi:hypothetical protein